MKYIYEGDLPLEEEIVKELILYSEMIMLKRLEVYCEKRLVNTVTKENAIEISKKLGSDNLQECALKFIGNNLEYFADELVKAKISVAGRQAEKSIGLGEGESLGLIDMTWDDQMKDKYKQRKREFRYLLPPVTKKLIFKLFVYNYCVCYTINQDFVMV